MTNNLKLFHFSHFSPRKNERYNSAHNGIYIVEKGTLEVFHSDGSKRTLTEGDFVLYNSTEINNANSLPSAKGFEAKAIVIPTEIFREISESHVGSVEPENTSLPVFCKKEHPLINQLKESLIELIASEASALVQHSVAKALAGLMVETEPQLMSVVNCASEMTASQRIIRYIEANIDRDISLETLSEHMSMSIATLKRRLAADKMTFSQILKVKRVNHAATQLRVSQKSITEIAFESGFKSAAHFSTAFKSIYNASPKDFRSQVRN